MSSITPVTGTTPASAQDTAAATISGDYTMFLKLLTTQMQNQDPLNPIDSTEYTSQLAQYSQVEQSIRQSQTLKDILASLNVQDLSQLAGMIGRQVEFDSATAGLSADAPAQWTFQAASPIARLEATIRDANGATVDVRTVDAAGAAGRFTWDGKLGSGGQAKPGGYSVSFAGTSAAGAPVAVTASSAGTVTNVHQSNGAVSLGVNGIDLPAASVTRIAAL